MSCAVAISGSPVFSPSRVSLFCKSSSSPETLTLGSPSTSPASALASSSQSPSFHLRCSQKQPSALKPCKFDARVPTDCSSSSSALSSAPTPFSVSKRRRPARIDIPAPSSLNFAAPSSAAAGPKEVEVDSARFSVFCKKGRRIEMEDRHAAVLDLQGDSKQAFFGIFDGHGGSKAAAFASEKLDKNIMSEVMKHGEGGTVAAVKNGYLITDSQFSKEDAQGGTCCVTALIRNGDLFVSNTGDCRAVMSNGGMAVALTADHRPSREDERQRIESNGGYVDCCRGTWRLQGSLAVSRGIGDLHLKKWVIAEPETKTIRLKPDCEFLILASDGLWDKVNNQEAVDTVRTSCTDSSNRSSLLSACKNLVGLSTMRGSLDDISVMIIQLGHFI